MSGPAGENIITPLVSAIYVGDAASVGLLLGQGVDPDARDNSGQTALIKAAFCRQSEIVTMLVESGADVNACDDDGATALMLGIRGRRDDIVRTLLDKGADPHARNKVGVTALMAAAFHGNFAAVKLLLENGAETDARSADGQTALILADDANTAELLLENGSDINAADNNARTALMEAALVGEMDTAGLLLARGADPNAADNDGRTAMIWAILQEDRLTGLELQNDMTWKLLKTRCGLYKERPAVDTDAAMKDTVGLLLAHGAETNARDSRGWTALKLAGIRMKRAIVKLLVGAGGVLSQEDVAHLDFFSAIKNDNAAKTRRLLAGGFDVNAVNHRGVSGLGIAAYWNQVEIAELLLGAGADTELRDDYGVTALACAERRGNDKIVEIINDKRRLP